MNLDDGHVGIGVDVVRAKLRDVREGVDGGGVLLGVEQRDAVVVPSHPLLVFGRVGRNGWFSPTSNVREVDDHVDDGLLVVFPAAVHSEVHEVLIEAAVFDSSGESDRTDDAGGMWKE